VTTRWIGAAFSPAGGPAAHDDHVLLAGVDSWGLGADFVCTHVDRSGVVATTTMSARVDGEPDLAALGATLLTGPRPDGRAVRFPGQSLLTGRLPAAELVTRSAIDEVVAIGVPVGPDSVVETAGFLRPTFTGGRLVLLVEPAAGGVLRPVEIEQPHQCCGGHQVTSVWSGD
jgi:hypothetical protein